MDKSLDDLIKEQREKGRGRSSGGDRKQHAMPRDRRNGVPDSRRTTTRRDVKQQDPAAPPPRDPAYFLHDDRDGGWTREEQGVPAGSWKQQQRQHWDRQQQRERPRGRGGAAAAGATDPIITTADGWEEVAQEDPYVDRRGGSRVQRRGGVMERLTHVRGDAGSGRYNTRQYERRQQQEPYGGGGRFGRGRGRGGGSRGRDGDFDGEPRRRYYDEHDHRDEGQGGFERPSRYQPYRVAGGVSKPRFGRGGLGGGVRKWGHDLFDPNQPVSTGEDAGGEAEAGDMME